VKTLLSGNIASNSFKRYLAASNGWWTALKSLGVFRMSCFVSRTNSVGSLFRIFTFILIRNDFVLLSSQKNLPLGHFYYKRKTFKKSANLGKWDLNNNPPSKWSQVDHSMLTSMWISRGCLYKGCVSNLLAAARLFTNYFVKLKKYFLKKNV